MRKALREVAPHDVTLFNNSPYCQITQELWTLLLGILIAVRLSDPAPLEELRLRSFDLFNRFSPGITKARPVAILDIDEASLSAYGQWPWPGR